MEGASTSNRKRKASDSEDSPSNTESKQQYVPSRKKTCFRALKKRRFQPTESVNTKKWNRLCRKADSWLDNTKKSNPDFVMLFMSHERGRKPQPVWKGPEHMKLFAEDKYVLQKFEEASLSREIGQLHYKEENTKENTNVVPRIQLPFLDPEDYTIELLSKLLSRIMNPQGVYGFFGDCSNKPQWFPDDLPFKSPCHPPKGEKKYSSVEMRTILRAFLDKCPSRYSISSDCKPTTAKDPKSPAGSDVSATELHTKIINMDTESDNDDILNKDGTLILTPTKTQADETFVPDMSSSDSSHKEVLKTVLGILPSEWPLWLNNMESKLMLQFSQVLASSPLSVEDIPRKHLDSWLQGRLQNRIPKGMRIGRSSKDGNCFFHSLSIILFGNESASSLLRLQATFYAIKYQQQMLKTLCTEFRHPDNAQQFVCTVATSNSVFSNRPKDNPTIDELLIYILQQETKATAVNGEYAGLLQIQFLCNAIGIPIQQHCQLDTHRDTQYDSLVLPQFASGDLRPPIHIMWAEAQWGSGVMNHIVPLFPSKDLQMANVSVGLHHNLAESVKGYCAMERSDQCIASLLVDDDFIWVNCDRCKTWYHCACVGMLFLSGDEFVCCSPVAPKKSFTVIRGGQKAKNYELNVKDVHSLYPDQGISEGVIDFYVRHIIREFPIPKCMKVVSAVTTQKLDDTSGFKRMFRSANGRCDLKEYDWIIFPCRVNSWWHWILIGVYIPQAIAYVFDSYSTASLAAYSSHMVKLISRFLKVIINLSTDLKPEVVKVFPQVGNDCGIHVVHNLTLLLKCADLEGLSKVREFKKKFVPSSIRGNILRECYLLHAEQRLTMKDGCKTRSANGKQPSMDIYDKITNRFEDGLKVIEVPDKGKGVITTKHRQRGDFICEYSGELITYIEAKKREALYAQDQKIGCFMYYFSYNNTKYCVDATKDDHRFGRLLNHSRSAKKANVSTKLCEVDGKPHLYFIAVRGIEPKQELLYDYGERNKGIVQFNPWLGD